jgi:uncharacterized membrane protein YfcA
MLVYVVILAFLDALLTFFSGFGLGALLLPAIAIIFPVAIAVVVVAFIHLLHHVWKILFLWKNIYWPVVYRFGIPASCAAIPGALLFVYFSTSKPIFQYCVGPLTASVEPIKIIVGLSLILCAVLEGVAKHTIVIKERWLPLGGALSGFLGGVSGHQGAVRSLFLLHLNLGNTQFVATSAVLAIGVDVVRLAVYGLSVAALFHAINIRFVALLALATLAGDLVGKLVLEHVTVRFVHRVVLAMLCILGTALILGIF